MTTVTIPLIGGPYDAADDDDLTGSVDVELDEDGRPPWLYVLRVPGVYDHRKDPTKGSTLSTVTHFYDLEERGVTMNEHGVGPRWVYVHRGEHARDSKRHAA